MSRAFIIRTDYRGSCLERMPVCRCYWGERAGGRRLIRADNYFPRVKELNGEVWGILLHFGCFHCYCCLLSPKTICVQVKNPDMGGHGAARSTPRVQPPLWPSAAGLQPKMVALSTPQLNDMAVRPLLTPPLYWIQEEMRAGKGNERSKCWEARREPAQPRSSDKGLGL